jgi:hypothetical protein
VLCGTGPPLGPEIAKFSLERLQKIGGFRLAAARVNAAVFSLYLVRPMALDARPLLSALRTEVRRRVRSETCPDRK